VTRQIKGPGTDVMEREYVYADPPISYTDLAEKYGLARSNVAAKAEAGNWFKKREEFRRKVSEETRDAMAEKWAEMQIAIYERLGKLAVKYIDKYEKALDAEDSKIPISTKDMLGMASMVRTLTTDMAARPVSNLVVDPSTGEVFEGDEAEARAAIAKVKALMAGEATDGE
jgi:hypothetical protein